jgi:response regulator RpfG family c-di-GMP phosphodiesterase
MALTEQAASNYILKEKGGKFDPDLVDVFFEKILAIQSIENVENSIMAE